MIDGLAFSGPRYHENASTSPDGFASDRWSPCVVCGKPVDTSKASAKWVRVHNGGASIVTDAEAARLNAEGGEAGDMAYFAIGSACLRRHPEVRPYAVGKGEWRA